MSGDPPPRPLILLVEDEPSIADNVIYSLETEGFAVTHHTTGRDALRALSAHSLALIVLDIGLPDINGFELCREIRTRSTVPIIFMTARKSEVDRVVGLEIGGDDYVVKPFNPRELAARVKAVLRRCGPAATPVPIQSSRAFDLDEDRMTISYRGQPLALSRYEYRVLKTLLEHPGRVYSRDQLMEQAWEDPGSALDRTVDAHIKMLRAKLRAIDAEGADAIQTHRGMGYSLREGL